MRLHSCNVPQQSQTSLTCLLTSTGTPCRSLSLALLLLQEGKTDVAPKLDTLLAPDTDSEEEPDVELQIPANKIKYMVGQGGDKIKYIQRKTKCRVQVSDAD